MTHFDGILITAASNTQARGYRSHVAWRRAQGLIDAGTEVTVVPNPRGRRLGAGGAALRALAVLAEKLRRRSGGGRDLASLFRDRRVLIFNGVGEGRRLPVYAAAGKPFLPLPAAVRGENPATLFDIMLHNLERTPVPRGGQVIIVSGESLVVFDPSGVDLGGKGVIALASNGQFDRNAGRSIYVTEQVNEGLRVKEVLPRPSEGDARRAKALDAFGRVLADTGVFSLDPEAVADLLAAGADCSGDLAVALASYVPFSVRVTPRCEYAPLGATRDLVQSLRSLACSAGDFGFGDRMTTIIPGGMSFGDSFLFNAVIAHREVHASHGALLENVHVDVPLTMEEDTILVGLPRKTGKPLRLRKGLGLVCLPVGERDWAAVLCGRDDDFDAGLADGNARFLNEPFGDWLTERSLEREQLWDRGARHSIWNARFWVVGKITRALHHASWMQEPGKPKNAARWLSAPRLSLRQLLPQVNHQRLIAQREEIQRLVALSTLPERLHAHDTLSAAQVARDIRSREEAAAALKRIAEEVKGQRDPLFRARALQVGAHIVEQHRPGPAALRTLGVTSADALREAVFSAVGESVCTSLDLSRKPRPVQVKQDQVVWVTTPVRIDFAGGWSDTPPICIERGGAVLNAAVTLNGQYPVQVVGRLNRDFVIRLSSIDLGQHVEIRETAELLDHADPRTWTALPKAALTLAGIGPGDRRASLRRWLRAIGAGIDLTVFSAVPQGSGLGTSSILGASILACLERILGGEFSVSRLTSLTSALEQRMRTGGVGDG